MSVIVTGIHTDVGKTEVAALLTAGLGWTYWKPIQTGLPADRERISRHGLPTYPERYHLALPAAPLVAAQAEGITIDWAQLAAPPPPGQLVIEGAGGLYVPITPRHFLIDLFAQWRLPLILVVRPYLGAMNHTWLSLRAIQAYQLPLLGIVLNGTTGDPSENYFRQTFEILGEIPWGYSGSLVEVFRASGLAARLPEKLRAYGL
ncbi:MAG: dethiobiotin synthase [Bacteroidia bacterium]|nr:dethiobiotin synthase [Bacteroidia bacterium]MDW8088257.1 dethiobiotin synthase [Bacteroidia bacterium]